jgi:hypothetical protein
MELEIITFKEEEMFIIGEFGLAGAILKLI